MIGRWLVGNDVTTSPSGSVPNADAASRQWNLGERGWRCVPRVFVAEPRGRR